MTQQPTEEQTCGTKDRLIGKLFNNMFAWFKESFRGYTIYKRKGKAVSLYLKNGPKFVLAAAIAKQHTFSLFGFPVYSDLYTHIHTSKN